MNDNTRTSTRDDRVDGRTARRDRNRIAVLDAVIELFSEENLTPGVHQVAERSGVSLRSVYRYFDDVDDLVAAAIDRHVEQASHLFQMPETGVGSTSVRITRFCQRRMRLFTSVRAVYRASAIRSADQEQLSAQMDEGRIELSKQTAEMFAPELDELPVDRAVIVSGILDTLSQFDSLEHLFRNHAYDVEATTEFLADAFAEILL